MAQQWLEKYRADDGLALLELINCVLQCIGCEQEVTIDDIRDPENIPNRLADLHNAYQEVWFFRQEPPVPLLTVLSNKKLSILSSRKPRRPSLSVIS